MSCDPRNEKGLTVQSEGAGGVPVTGIEPYKLPVGGEGWVRAVG